MKRVLIMGLNSYLGTSLENHLTKYNAQQGREIYRVDKLSQRDDYWRTYALDSYDVIFQATGIAHADTGKLTREEKDNYYKINCDLAVETARRAKDAGVKQFIYPSSAIVYGDSAPFGQTKRITADTPVECKHAYGDSKIKAEEGLSGLADDTFQMAILRLPMIYGKDCKGNYPLLAKIAEKSPAFPVSDNERSMLYVENFCEFVRLLIDKQQGGLYFPQNDAYVNTSEMVAEIAAAKGKKIRMWKWLNPFVKLASKMPGKIGAMTNKAFGSLSYDHSLSYEIGDYNLYNFKESIQRTESYEG